MNKIQLKTREKLEKISRDLFIISLIFMTGVMFVILLLKIQGEPLRYFLWGMYMTIGFFVFYIITSFIPIISTHQNNDKGDNK